MTSAVDRLLSEARAQLERVGVDDLVELGATALVVDIRPESDRRAEGSIPGSVAIERNVLEWRLDPTCDARLDSIEHDPHRPVVVVCNEGYASSFAAVGLRRLGLSGATDLIGGHRAWVAAGHPVER